MRKNVLLILVHLTSYSIQAQLPWLHVDGNKIKDPSGNVVILRGVCTQNIRGQINSNFTLNRLIDTLTDVDNPDSNSPGWYTKIIRFTVEAPVAMDLTTYYTTYLKPSVDYATSKGLYVIIDYHHIADVQGHDQGVKAFWEFMAPKFKEYSNVLYEIYNEPINQSFTWNAFYPYMQSWINVVRKHAPHNLILAGSPWWDQRMSGSVTKPFTGGNIVYVAHVYPQHFTYPSNKSEVQQTAAVHPVFMSEWGFRQGATDNLLKGTITGYGVPIMAWAEQLGLSWTAWCADNDWEPAMFNNDWTLRVSENDMGGFVKDTLYAKRDKNQPVYSECNPPFLGQDMSLCGKTTIDVVSGMTADGKIFRWYKDNVIMDGESLPSLSVTASGTYKLEVETVSSGCKMSDEVIISGDLFPVDLGFDKAIVDPITLTAGSATDPFTYKWYKNNQLIDDATSYSLEIDDTCTTIFKVVVSHPGCGEVSDEFKILCPRQLFLGTPILVPGIVQAEHCDIQNIPNLAYYDTDASNNGGALRTDAVDVETCSDAGGGYNIGWLSPSEWYEYTIKVTDPGTYTASIRVASINSTGSLYLRANNMRNITATIPVPNTAGWQTWTTVTVENINLTEEDSLLRIFIVNGGFNLNYINLQKTVLGLKGQKSNLHLHLYPNPVNDILTIEGEKEYEWKVLDLFGEEMITGSGKQADLKSLSPGLYILKVEDSSFKIVKK